MREKCESDKIQEQQAMRLNEDLESQSCQNMQEIPRIQTQDINIMNNTDWCFLIQLVSVFLTNKN